MSEEQAQETETSDVDVANDSQESATKSHWYDSAEDELKGYIQNKGWDDPLKVVKGYKELEKYHGADPDSILKLPKEDDEDGWGNVYNRLGRPESADKYKLPEESGIDGDRFKLYADVAHKLGLSQKQLEGLAKFDAEYISQAVEQHNAEIKKQQEAEYEAVMKEWGANASEREELARRGLRSVMPKGVDAEVLISKIEDAIGTAATYKIFANVGEKLTREDKIHDSGDDRPFGYTREQALSDKAELMSELKADPQRLNQYNSGSGPDYDKMQKLLKRLAS